MNKTLNMNLMVKEPSTFPPILNLNNLYLHQTLPMNPIFPLEEYFCTELRKKHTFIALFQWIIMKIFWWKYLNFPHFCCIILRLLIPIWRSCLLQVKKVILGYFSRRQLRLFSNITHLHWNIYFMPFVILWLWFSADISILRSRKNIFK